MIMLFHTEDITRGYKKSSVDQPIVQLYQKRMKTSGRFFSVVWSCGGSESMNENFNLDSLTNPSVHYMSDFASDIVEWDVTEVLQIQ
ncbi:MAG: hypothetical protein R2780_12430 [Crocinitomicaceae bacterium]